MCYRGLPDRREYAVGFLIHEEIVWNIDEFFSIYERVAVVVIKLNKRYKLKVVQAYASASSHDDNAVERFYEDVESAMKRVKAQ